MSTARVRRSEAARLTMVPYDMYVHLRNAPGNQGLRMTYHDGVLEIMSPEFRHEQGGRRLYQLVAVYCDAFDVPCETAGATTFHKGAPGRLEGKGKEPDESFYIGKEAVAAVAGKASLDLAVDPPPSLWIEVDNRASSRAKLPLYAALGVPEVWRYRPRRRRLWFGRLAGEGYEAVDASAVLPGLTPALVLEAMSAGESLDLTARGRYLRDVWLPQHRQELIDRGAAR